MERLLAAATALLAVTAANAADLPKMFLGNWENMTITQRGYIGLGEDCRFNSIAPATQGLATLVDVTCGLEDELKPQRSRAVMDIKLIDGKQVLIIANTSSKYPSIEILRNHEPSQPR